jgi:hypothetical protein
MQRSLPGCLSMEFTPIQKPFQVMLTLRFLYDANDYKSDLFSWQSRWDAMITPRNYLVRRPRGHAWRPCRPSTGRFTYTNKIHHLIPDVDAPCSQHGARARAGAWRWRSTAASGGRLGIPLTRQHLASHRLQALDTDCPYGSCSES